MAAALTPLQSQALTQAIDLPNKGYMLPQSIPMWPPVWWTWLIVAAVALIIICMLILWYQRHKKRTYRREALSNIRKAADGLTDKECIQRCHEMVRRCLISEGKTETAALPSHALFAILDKSMPAKRQFASLASEFIDGPYRNQIELTQEQRSTMIKNTCYWIRKHHA